MSKLARFDPVKKPYSLTPYSEQEEKELEKCLDDPIYFCENFVKIQHPTKGEQAFVPFPFQIDMLNAFHNNRFSIMLTARQMGKCVFGDSIVTLDGVDQEIGSLIRLGWRDRLIGWLERLAIRLS